MDFSNLSHLATSALSDASSKGADEGRNPPQGEVGGERHSLAAITQEQREQAIQRAADLVDYLHAEYRCYEALWLKHGDFTAKASFDVAYSNYHKALEIAASLIQGRTQ